MYVKIPTKLGNNNINLTMEYVQMYRKKEDPTQDLGEEEMQQGLFLPVSDMIYC